MYLIIICKKKEQDPIGFVAEENKQAGRMLKKSLANVSQTGDGWSGVLKGIRLKNSFPLVELPD